MMFQSVCQISYQVSWPWHLLFFVLLAFNLDLQAKWIFCSAFLIWVVIWGTSFHINCTCLQLVCFRPSGFEVCLLFLESHACKVAKLVASFTLVILCRTLKSLQVGCVTTFGTYVLVIVCTLRVKPLLVLYLQMVTLTALWLVVRLFWLHRWSFFCTCLLATLYVGV